MSFFTTTDFYRKDRAVGGEFLEKISWYSDFHIEGEEISENTRGKESDFFNVDSSCDLGVDCIKLNAGPILYWGGFNLISDSLVVESLQGKIKFSKSPELVDLIGKMNCKSLFVRGFINLAQKLDLEKIKVRGVRNNYWADLTYNHIRKFEPEVSWGDLIEMSRKKFLEFIQSIKKHNSNFYLQNIHLFPNRGFKIYDQTALDLGFNPDGEGDYIFSLK